LLVNFIFSYFFVAISHHWPCLYPVYCSFSFWLLTFWLKACNLSVYSTIESKLVANLVSIALPSLSAGFSFLRVLLTYYSQAYWFPVILAREGIWLTRVFLWRLGKGCALGTLNSRWFLVRIYHVDILAFWEPINLVLLFGVCYRLIFARGLGLCENGVSSRVSFHLRLSVVWVGSNWL